MKNIGYIAGRVWLVSHAVQTEYFNKAKNGGLELTQEEMDKRRIAHKKATQPQFHSAIMNLDIAAKCGKKRSISYRGKDVSIMDSYEMDCEEYENEPSMWANDVLGEIKLRGVLQKESGMCTKGTCETMEELVRMGEHPRVKGVLLNIDSGGGEVSGVEEFAKCIASFRNTYKKPIFAYVSDAANSAAYWLASQCDKVYLSGQNAQVGSIGTMVTLIDDSKMMEDLGVNLVTIRATQSFNKNEAYYQALEGNDEPLRKEFLDVINKNFQNSVTSKRVLPNIETVNNVAIQLTGKVFLGSDAVRAGLADGIVNSLKDAFVELNKESQRMAKEQRANAQITAKQNTGITTEQVNSLNSSAASAANISSNFQSNFNMNPLKALASLAAKIFGTSEKEVKIQVNGADMTAEQEQKLNAALSSEFQTELMQSIAQEQATSIVAQAVSQITEKMQANTQAHEAKIKELQTALDVANEALQATNSRIDATAKEVIKTKGLPTNLEGNTKGDNNPLVAAQKEAQVEADFLHKVEIGKQSPFANSIHKKLEDGTISVEQANIEFAKYAR